MIHQITHIDHVRPQDAIASAIDMARQGYKEKDCPYPAGSTVREIWLRNFIRCEIEAVCE